MSEPQKTSESRKIPFGNWSSLDIVTMVVIAAIFGVFGVYGQFFWNAVYAIGGFWLSNIFSGIFHTPGLLSANMVRKGAGVAFVGQVLFGVAEVLMGTPIGYNVLILSVLEGIGFEIGLAVWRYRRYDWASIALGAALSAPLSTIWVYIWQSLWAQPLWTWLIPEGLKFLYILPVVLTLVIGVPEAMKRVGITLPYQRSYKVVR